MGDWAGALESSAKARKFAIYAAIVTVVGSVLMATAAFAGLLPAMTAAP